MPARRERQGRETRASPTRTTGALVIIVTRLPERGGISSEHSVAQSVCPVGSPQTVSSFIPALNCIPVGGNPHVFST